MQQHSFYSRKNLLKVGTIALVKSSWSFRSQHWELSDPSITSTNDQGFEEISTAPIISHQMKLKRMLLTKLSSPPPRRSTAPICMEETWGTFTGGPRSRLRRSPRRSPCDGMTCGCSRFVVAVVPTGLSPASVLWVGGIRSRREKH